MSAATLPVEVDPAPIARAAEYEPVWPLWQRALFRFFAVYLVLQIAPWNWFDAFPGMPFVLDSVQGLIDWAVITSNASVFHVRDTLVLPNGSGDTSWAWTQFRLYLVVALLACVVWSLLDRKRSHYEKPLYWLRLVVRYYLATFALSYGIIKLFALQMPFPLLSQLATPLGDLLPMRLSWLFIGYSFPYQVFSGAMETLAGLLLLNRRTVTAGVFAATGAFANVVMINLAYDVPVKLFASHLLFASVFLLALDAKRLVNLLVLNRTVPATRAYDSPLTTAWQQWAAIGLKVYFVFQILMFPLKSGWTRYQAVNDPPIAGAFRVGVYDVRHFVVNRDTVPSTASDTLRWKDVIIDNTLGGSVNTADQMFFQRYRRGYFRYRTDTTKRIVNAWRTSVIPGDSAFAFSARYEVPDTNTIRLHTVIRGDSVHMELVRVPRHFQLTERQFHWVSEYNR